MRSSIVHLILVVILIGCEKNDKQDKAEEYMDKIVSETYSDMFLPDLEPDDISTLLKYRNEKTNLQVFPVNPISSFICDSVTVGIIALWTIESIRISELNGDTSDFMRFPSLNPMLLDTTRITANKSELQDSASERYYNWWYQSNLMLSEKLIMNPLHGSDIVWR